MNTEAVLSEIRAYAEKRPLFLLSEVLKNTGTASEIHEILSAVRPYLVGMYLGARKTPDDAEVFWITAPSYRPGKSESERFEKSLQDAGVPGPLNHLIEDYIRKKTGKRWDDPQVLERIRGAVVAQKDSYWKEGEGRVIRYIKGYSVLGYLAYQFPVYFVQFQHVMKYLADEGLLKQRMVVLDAGTGPGTVPLAIIESLRYLRCSALIYGVEQSEEHAEAYSMLVPAYAEGGKTVVGDLFNEDIITFDPSQIPATIDLMVFSNVLNELGDLTPDKRADLVLRLSEALAEDGTIVLLEPADLANSTMLRQLSLLLKRHGLTIYSPCPSIWRGRCKVKRCWSFVEYPEIQRPPLMKKLMNCKESYRYDNTDIKFTYVIIRKDERVCCRVSIPKDRNYFRLSSMGEYVGEKTDVIVSVISGDLGNPKNAIYRICDGTGRKETYAILPRIYADKSGLLLKNASYGDLLALNGVKVMYNPDHDAYNLLITRTASIQYL